MGKNSRSSEGITVGLIDTIINCATLLAKRQLYNSKPIAEALKDLQENDDLLHVLCSVHYNPYILGKEEHEIKRKNTEYITVAIAALKEKDIMKKIEI